MKKNHTRIIAILSISFSDYDGLLSQSSLRALVRKIKENRTSLITDALSELRSGMITSDYGALLLLIEFVNDHAFGPEINSDYGRQFIDLVGDMNAELCSMLRDRNCVVAQ